MLCTPEICSTTLPNTILFFLKKKMQTVLACVQSVHVLCHVSEQAYVNNIIWQRSRAHTHTAQVRTGTYSGHSILYQHSPTPNVGY